MDKLTVRDFDPAGKRVFVRVDFNVPLADGKVVDDSRIRASIPTIAYLLDRGAMVILASHLGRPGGKVNDTSRLRPVGLRLSELLRRPVRVTGDALGAGTLDALARLKPGQAILLENLRFHAAEEANDPAFAKALASYADVYVNDAFGTAHRAHASTVGVAKVSDKLRVLENLMSRVDTFVVGGGMANTFFVAMGYTVGKSLLERDRVEDAARILALAEEKGGRFLLPTAAVGGQGGTRGARR